MPLPGGFSCIHFFLIGHGQWPIGSTTAISKNGAEMDLLSASRSQNMPLSSGIFDVCVHVIGDHRNASNSVKFAASFVDAWEPLILQEPSTHFFRMAAWICGGHALYCMGLAQRVLDRCSKNAQNQCILCINTCNRALDFQNLPRSVANCCKVLQMLQMPQMPDLL